MPVSGKAHYNNASWYWWDMESKVSHVRELATSIRQHTHRVHCSPTTYNVGQAKEAMDCKEGD